MTNINIFLQPAPIFTFSIYQFIDKEIN